MGDFLLAALDDAVDSIRLDPGWGFTEQQVQRRSQHRTQNGDLYTYPWIRYLRFTVPLDFVNSAESSRINQWWQADALLTFTLDTSASVSTVLCRAVNGASPLNSRTAPYPDRYRGSLVLEGVSAGGKTPRPFILDDGVLGLLDQPYNAIL